jgi:DNA mismatch repair protein MutL
VSDGYRSLLPKGRYPFAVIMIDIDPSRVDVNVHPTKQEVRFDNSGAVHSFVASAIRKSFSRLPKTTDISPPPLMGGDKGEGGSIKFDFSPPPSLPPAKRPAGRHQGGEVYCQVLRTQSYSPSVDSKFFSPLNVIGQLANSFIICEGLDKELVVVDQHAAHERIGFEILKDQLSKNKIEQQQLLIPEQVELHPKDAGYISENLEILNKVGIEIEPFGGNTFIIKALPALLADSDMKGLVVKLAHDLSEFGDSSQTEEVIENILKTMACHRQVRFGHSLALDEMKHLLNEMDKWPNTDRCPHGRPSFIKFDNTEIRKWFERM